jgi:glutathione S-transferase
MTSFDLHSVPASPYGRAALMALKEKGAAWKLRPVPAGNLKSEAHLARHPFGKVPVLEHDGFVLYETQAILRYLERIIPEPRLIPANPRDAARMDQAMNACDCYLYSGVVDIIAFERLVKPRLLGGTADESRIALAMPKGRTAFRVLSDMLGANLYFAGSQLSLADIMLAPHVDFLRLTPEWSELAAHHRNLTSWLARMAERPSFQTTTWESIDALAKAA